MNRLCAVLWCVGAGIMAGAALILGCMNAGWLILGSINAGWCP